MCFYVDIKIKAEKVKKHYGTIKPRFNEDIFPKNEFISGFNRPSLPILFFDKTYQIDNYHWGLIPDWAEQTDDFALNTLNARKESLLSKPSFKDYIDSQRGILPVNGFYEWQHNGKSKIKFHITHFENQILNIGVVYHRFINQKQENIQTFSIITQKANQIMEEIHNTKKRMPLIIPNGEEEIWLSKSLNYFDSAKMIHSIKEYELKAMPLKNDEDKLQISLF